ncbi:ATP-binding protein [Streptomyces sp. KM273126]|uniref:ATP-binding protein n=1 Tax=Streptomyces sp. KM273126 TaxID=2545247 RepID=UPI001405580C|nr:ATP-binding protein [Streptomyces sp. KM273126]MBA2809861.1 ATP-binding protein [Streptomyces sp. KM273126]
MNVEIPHPSPRERFYRRERASVPAARSFAREALADWGVRERAYDVVLCVSELATNALVHGVPPGRGFLLRLLPLRYDGGVRVEVHDSGDGVPAVPQADVREPGEGGRGLLLVSELADKWGVGERDPGKIVWCEFAGSRPSSPGGPGGTGGPGGPTDDFVPFRESHF